MRKNIRSKALAVSKVIAVFLLVLTIIPSVWANDDAEKKQLFQQYMVETGGVVEYQKILNAIRKQTAQVFNHILSEKNKSGKKVSEEESSVAIARAQISLNQWIGKEMGFGDISENVFYPAHAKAYSTQDLKDILVFFKSEAGKKYKQQKDQLMQQSFQILSELYLPRLQEEMVNSVQVEVDKLLQ